MTLQQSYQWNVHLQEEHTMILSGIGIDDKSPELDVYKHSPICGTMPGMHFREHEFELKPGDRMFVYTDGLPEATNAEKELFGADRVLEVLNNNTDVSVHELLYNVTKSVEEFVGEADQFDDLTMLGFYYNGPKEKSE